MEKMERLLSDNIYKIIDKHPTKKFTDELRSLLDERKMSLLTNLLTKDY